jgi:hypothetical protein
VPFVPIYKHMIKKVIETFQTETKEMIYCDFCGEGINISTASDKEIDRFTMQHEICDQKKDEKDDPIEFSGEYPID